MRPVLLPEVVVLVWATSSDDSIGGFSTLSLTVDLLKHFFIRKISVKNGVITFERGNQQGFAAWRRLWLVD